LFIQNYTLIASVAAQEAPFIELLAVESTNNYAIGLIHAGMPTTKQQAKVSGGGSGNLPPAKT
jgi:hypothetical protein